MDGVEYNLLGKNTHEHITQAIGFLSDYIMRSGSFCRTIRFPLDMVPGSLVRPIMAVGLESDSS